MEVKILTFASFVVLYSFSQAHVSASDTRIREKRSYCGGRIHSTEGQIESPNYPSNYPSDRLCTWYLTVPEHSRIRLTFTSFQLESSSSCQYDYVEIRDGPYSSSELLGRLCGSIMPEPIVSTGNAMTIKFNSDGSSQYKGFQAEYSRAITCGGHLTSDQGDVSSPNYPLNYGENESCKWYISVPKTFQIRLRFRSFQLESSHDCDADSLRIYDGHNEHSRPLGSFCGNVTRNIVSSGNTMTLVFLSDATSNYRGFSAQYSKVKPTVVAMSAAQRNIPAVLMVGAIVCFAFHASI